jgi:hypothetical protein
MDQWVKRALLADSLGEGSDMYYENWISRPGLVAGQARTRQLYKECFKADEMLREYFCCLPPDTGVVDEGGMGSGWGKNLKAFNRFIEEVRKRGAK